VVHEGYLERPQFPGASTAIHRDARRQWQIRGVGRVTDQGGTAAKPHRLSTINARSEGEAQ
jgi:hypothetical protein